MERQAINDRQGLGLSAGPSAVGYAAKELVDLHKGYYSTARRIMMSSKSNAKEGVVTFDSHANSHFNSIHELMAQLAEKLDEEFRAMLKDMDDALTLVARQDRWWEDLNVLSQGMNASRWQP
jgi:hypothetical protein